MWGWECGVRPKCDGYDGAIKSNNRVVFRQIPLIGTLFITYAGRMVELGNANLASGISREASLSANWGGVYTNTNLDITLARVEVFPNITLTLESKS